MLSIQQKILGQEKEFRRHLIYSIKPGGKRECDDMKTKTNEVLS